jgi:hypothetical protein
MQHNVQGRRRTRASGAATRHWRPDVSQAPFRLTISATSVPSDSRLLVLVMPGADPDDMRSSIGERPLPSTRHMPHSICQGGGADHGASASGDHIRGVTVTYAASYRKDESGEPTASSLFE